jgi:hypothetical protein
MANRHSELDSERSNVIPNLIRNPLINEGMLNQVQHGAGRITLEVQSFNLTYTVFSIFQTKALNPCSSTDLFNA